MREPDLALTLTLTPRLTCMRITAHQKRVTRFSIPERTAAASLSDVSTAVLGGALIAWPYGASGGGATAGFAVDGAHRRTLKRIWLSCRWWPVANNDAHVKVIEPHESSRGSRPRGANRGANACALTCVASSRAEPSNFGSRSHTCRVSCSVLCCLPPD